MDRNTTIGFSLIFAILIGFYFYTKPSAEQLAAQQKTSDSITLVQKLAEEKAQKTANVSETATVSKGQTDTLNSKQLGGFIPHATTQDVTIKNKDLAITLSGKGGAIKQIELLNHKRWDDKQLLMLNEQMSHMYLEIKTPGGALRSQDVNWQLAQSSDMEAVYRLPNGDSGYIEQKISLPASGYVFDYKIRLKNVQNDIYRGNSDLILVLNPFLNKQEKDKKWEQQRSALNYKMEGENPDDIGQDEEESETLKGRTEWVSFTQQYFNITIANTEGFDRESLLRMNNVKADTVVRDMEAQLYLNYNPEDDRTYAMRIFAGPNDYDALEEADLGVKNHRLESIIPLGWGIFGWINEYMVIPLFNVLTESIAMTGLAIILLTIIIKFLLLPLVYKSYISTAKMRILKPEIERIKEKYNGDMQKHQTENMALYKKAGVSPMSGCVPLLFQMPVLFAMFQFFPSAFQLRQKSFLWADDLSRYDSIFNIGFDIPFYGDHVSLFTLLMTLSTLLYTHFNNQITGASGQMKYIGYIMPVVFLGVLNDYASGLTLYYLVSNLVTFGQQWVIRQRVNDDKLRVQIANARKKPVTKSKFQARMEAAMKQQQAKKGK